MDVFGWLNRSKGKQNSIALQGQLGVSLSSEGTALVRVDHKTADTKPVLTHCAFLPAENSFTAQQAALLRWLEAEDLRECPLNIVLSSDHYQLILVEAPEVEVEERASAIRWRIKDLLTVEPEEAVIDVFDLSDKPIPGKGALIYVVAAAKEAVLPWISFAQSQKLNLLSIDINELALRNLLFLDKAWYEGAVFLTIQAEEGDLVMVQKGFMVLNRHVDVGANILKEGTPEVFEHLSLEIQRSLDYYESYFGLHAPTHLVLAPMAFNTKMLAQKLASQLNVQVHPWELRRLLQVEPHLAENFDERHLQALGGALRGLFP